jgi:hypothetical protein
MEGYATAAQVYSVGLIFARVGARRHNQEKPPIAAGSV